MNAVLLTCTISGRPTYIGAESYKEGVRNKNHLKNFFKHIGLKVNTDDPDMRPSQIYT